MANNPTNMKEQAVRKTMCMSTTPIAMATATEAWAYSPLLPDIHCSVYILQN